MMAFELTRHGTLAGSPVQHMTSDYAQEIFDSGFSESGTVDRVNLLMPAIVASVGGEPIGFMAYFIHLESTFWIQAAYVIPSERRQGVHSAMFRELVAFAKEVGIKEINSGTHFDNHVSRSSQEKQGRKPHGVYYKFKIEEGA